MGKLFTSHNFIWMSFYISMHQGVCHVEKIHPIMAKLYISGRWLVCAFQDTLRCCYNMFNFLTNIHKRHPIACPLAWGMGCLLWIRHLTDILPQFLQLFRQYLTILGRVITALDYFVQMPGSSMILAKYAWVYLGNKNLPNSLYSVK